MTERRLVVLDMLLEPDDVVHRSFDRFTHYRGYATTYVPCLRQWIGPSQYIHAPENAVPTCITCAVYDPLSGDP